MAIMEDHGALRVVLLVLMGLAIFLHAIGHLSSTLRELAGGWLERELERCTRHVLGALGIGVLATLLLQSSSVVIILTIILVNSGKMRHVNALGVVLGANVGTTFSSQIIAFDIGEWSAVPLLMGLLLQHASRTPRWRATGEVLFSFGLLFAALFMMGYAVQPLKHDARFLSWLHGLEDPVHGALIGGLLTLVIQSSSATVAMAITMAGKGLLTLPAGVAVMLGAELGTCSDTLIATIRGNRASLLVGLFHLLFNLATIILGLVFIAPFIALVGTVTAATDISRSIANAHMLFNILGVLVMLPFTQQATRGLERLLRISHGSKAQILTSGA